MQKVKITNPRGSIEFTTDKPNGMPVSYVFESLYGQENPQVNVFESQGVGQRGATYHSKQVRPRDMDLGVYCFGMKREELYQARHDLNILVAYDGLSRIEYANDWGAWWIEGVVTQMPYSPRVELKGHFQHIAIALHCPDPDWRLLGQQADVSLAYKGGQFKFPFSIRGRGVTFGAGGFIGNPFNAGSADAPVEIKIHGPADYPRIENRTVGERIPLNIKIAPFETIYINTAFQKTRIEVRNTLSKEVHNIRNLMPFGPENRLWSLAPGHNDIRYFNTADENLKDTVIELSWEPRTSGV